MPFIRIIDEQQAEGDLARIYDSCQERAGYVAGILKLQCHDPGVLQASIRFYIQLMKAPNALSGARREMLATVVSNVNDCYY